MFPFPTDVEDTVVVLEGGSNSGIGRRCSGSMGRYSGNIKDIVLAVGGAVAKFIPGLWMPVVFIKLPQRLVWGLILWLSG